jgi:Tol biopolymer transport system component
MRSLAAALLFAAGLAPAQQPSFISDVAPILANYCYGCHAAAIKMGSLDLETPAGLANGGAHGPVLMPGKSADSRLFQMITGKAKPAMPMDGRALAAGEIEMIRKWIDSGAKPPTDAEVAEFRARAAAAKTPQIKPRTPVKPQIFALAWRPDGKLIAVAGHKEVRLADASGKQSGSLTGHAGVVRALAFSTDGKWLAAAGGLPGQQGEVKIWDVDARTSPRTINGHSDCIYAVAISPDGKTIATSSYDKLVKLWDAAAGNELRTLKDHIDAVYALAFTPDGKRVLSGAADRTVKVWDVATGERLYTMGEPVDGINSIALSPDGKMVAAAGQDKTIRIWTLGDRSGTLLNSLIAHEDAILKIAWSPDGKTLISSSADKVIKMFRVPDLTEVKAWASQTDWAYGLEFSPDGRTFAAGRYDGSLTVYDAAVTPGAALRAHGGNTQ